MNKLPPTKRAQILSMMVEGNSIRSITRMADVSKNTVIKFLEEAGKAFAEYQDKNLRNLPCKRVQCDEIWSFVYAKDKNAPAEMRAAGEAGDVWTWTAICADTKLICAWMMGDRNAAAANEFMTDLAGRLSNRVQLSTDGLKAYLIAAETAFGGEVDFARLVKLYGPGGASGRYSPGECIGMKVETVSGRPDPVHISTSYVERQNLSMRMGMRRFTRLTNAFSKKMENHEFAQAVYFMHYNFARIHQSLRVTPAMQAGIAKSPMTFEQMVEIIDAAAPKPSKRGPYKKKIST